MNGDLNKKLQFILDSELSAYIQNGRIRGGLGTFNVTLQSVPNHGWTTDGSVTQYLFDEANKDFIQSENATLILKLYSSSDEIKRQEIERMMLSCIDRQSKLKDISYLIVFVFIRIGKFKIAIDKAFNDLQGDSNNAYSNMLHMLKLVISREYSFFNFEELSDVKELLKNDNEAGHALLPTLREACKELVDQELNNKENMEVGMDMKNLVTFFNVNFPDGGISNQIKHIEDLFKQGDFSQESYATCVDRIRVLLVDVVRYLAIKKGIKNSGNKDDKVFTKFLYDNQHITKYEHELIITFYSLCSNNGSHISRTTKNTARLVKNMGFEIVALLSSYTEDV
jgi:hypothetical protein